MKILVTGNTGFIGKTVYLYLKTRGHTVEGLDSCPPHSGGKYDVIVNCAGSSSKYLAEKCQDIDFSISVDVVKMLLQLPKPTKLIHISSVDCSYGKSNYEFTNQITEEAISHYFSNIYTILRLPAVVGPGLKKNLIYDLLHERKIWVAPDSQFNIITSRFVAQIVEKCMCKIKAPSLLTVAANRPVLAIDIPTILGCKKPDVWGEVRQDYQDTEPSSFLRSLTKSSEEFLRDFLKEENNDN